MKITCNIIQDMLPLYVDDVLSEDRCLARRSGSLAEASVEPAMGKTESQKPRLASSSPTESFVRWATMGTFLHSAASLKGAYPVSGADASSCGSDLDGEWTSCAAENRT